MGLLVRASAATCSAKSASESIFEGARVEGVIARRFSQKYLLPKLVGLDDPSRLIAPGISLGIVFHAIFIDPRAVLGSVSPIGPEQ